MFDVHNVTLASGVIRFDVHNVTLASAVIRFDVHNVTLASSVNLMIALAQVAL
jgi:hypothetical protein